MKYLDYKKSEDIILVLIKKMSFRLSIVDCRLFSEKRRHRCFIINKYLSVK
jgi:hypothetical protein